MQDRELTKRGRGQQAGRGAPRRAGQPTEQPPGHRMPTPPQFPGEFPLAALGVSLETVNGRGMGSRKKGEHETYTPAAQVLSLQCAINLPPPYGIGLG